MRVLFIDHKYHEKTSSSVFFVELLKQFFDVAISYVDPSDLSGVLNVASARDFDIVVLWQIDFLAPYFLSRGIKTIVVPMYDGSGQMPPLHWLWARQARFICFSRRLHERIMGLGGRSLLVRYFPEAVQDLDLSPHRFSKLRVLLWQRRPEHGINVDLVERLFGDSIDELHVHAAPDDPNLDSSTYLKPELGPYTLTKSTWFKSSAEYKQLLGTFNVFVAPRRSEGIGLSFLEAMANGMVVCAHDDATHDEYISNGVNGILFNASASQQHIDLSSNDRRRELGEMAHITVSDGCKVWQQSSIKLIDFIRNTETPLIIGTDIDAENLLRGLAGSYFAGLPAYGAYLTRNQNHIEHFAGVKLDNSSNKVAALPHARNDVEPRIEAAWLDQNRLTAAQLESDRYLAVGQVRSGEGVLWLLSDHLSIRFRIDIRTRATARLRINFERGVPTPLGYCVVLNGRVLGIGNVEDEDRFELPITPGICKFENELQLQFKVPPSSNADSVVGIRSIDFM